VDDLNVEHCLESLTRQALIRTDGNRTEAAKLLGVSIRTLRNWINKFKLKDEFPSFPPVAKKAL
jgi:DNA-binding NtrC family response regulator